MGDHYDAIVIGTGFGGAVTACRLAQAGIHTLVLERGRRYDLASLPDLPKPGQIFPDNRRYGILWIYPRILRSRTRRKPPGSMYWERQSAI